MIGLDFVLISLGGTAITLGGVITAVVILVAGFVIAGVVQAFLRRLRGRYEQNSSGIYIVEKLAGYGLVIIGAVIALSSLGLNLSSLAVFAGALGIGVGLGLQGVVKEFVSGLVLVFDGVINVGDYIGEYEAPPPNALMLLSEAAGGDPDLLNGAETYNTACLFCHGEQAEGGHGGGPSLRTLASSGAATQVVIEGRNTMPPFGAVLSPEAIRDVVAYLFETLHD